MRSLAKIYLTLGLVAAIVAAASAADARSRHTLPSPDAYGSAYDAVSPSTRSIPYDAGGPAYTGGQRDINTSSDFQLQGR
jgi:hypothetical protein